MRVDEPREKGAFGEVEHERVRRERVRGRLAREDAVDPAVSDDDDGVV